MSKNKSNSNDDMDQSISNGDVMRTMQLDDLDLGKAGNSNNEEKSNQLLDDVENLIQSDSSLDADVDATNPMEHVDAISRRIEELSASLQQPLNNCDCHETADRMIAIDARLAKLQNEVNKQTGRGDKLESGLELINAFGNKVESLTDVVKLSMMEEEVKEDYTGHFQELANQIETLKKSLGDLPDNSEDFAKQSDSIQALDLRVAEVLEQSKKTPGQLDELTGKLNEMVAHLDSTDPLKGLDQKLESMVETLSQDKKFAALGEQLESVAKDVKEAGENQQTDQLNELTAKVEAIASLVQNNDKLADMETQLESIAGLVANNDKLVSLENQLDGIAGQVKKNGDMGGLETQLETIVGLVQNNESLVSLDKKIDSLSSSMADQQSLEQPLEQLNQQLNQKIDSLASVADQSAALTNLGEQLGTLKESLSENKQLGELTAKFEKLHDFVKLGALENEQFDADRFNAMGDQITAIGQMLVEGKANSNGGGGEANAQVEALSGKLDSLVQLVQQNAVTASAAATDNGAVELLIQKFEGLQKFVSKNIAAQGSDDGEASRKHAELLIQKFEGLQEFVATNISAAGSGTDGTSLQQIELLTSKLDSLALLVETNSQQASSDEGSSARIDELSNKLDGLATLMQNREESPATFEGEIPDYSNQIQALAEKVEETQTTVNTLVSSLVPLVETIQNGALAAPAAGAEGGAGDWEQQKKAMLEGYGMEEGSDAEGDEAAAAQGGDPNEEIEALRAELEEKLRRAEIDISIERAKIHQERRDLEEMQNDIDRKQQKINTHGSSSNSGSEEAGEDGESPGRWSRFLGN